VSGGGGAEERGEVDRAAFPYKMKDLCERTGLPRQVIHFYIHEGLVPEGRKTGRNMAYYGEPHLERLRLVRRLQEESFLPLKAIRALLEERDEAFSPAQRELLGELKTRLSGVIGALPARPATIDAGELLDRLGLAPADLDALVEAGLLAATRGEDGRPRIAREDAWMIELWGEIRAAGFTEELGFGASDLAMYEEAISALFAREARLVATRLAHLPPARVAAMVERTLPLVHTFLARYHATRVRNFFAAV